jgi:osomolarity two-component system sensor histidine kinase NIK1
MNKYEKEKENHNNEYKNPNKIKDKSNIDNNNKDIDKDKDNIYTKYFDIVIRRIEIEKNNYIYDCLFFDVTKIIKSKIKMYEENCKREKILAKMAHEFKTPINSIIGLIGIIKENLLTNKQNSESTLNLIENLSKYVLFLISDIVHYLNPFDNHDIKIQKDNINLKENMNFCFEILKSLISCNRTKMENVKAEMHIDSSLNDLNIYTDEQRFKQILLNLLSNSVKFTNNGYIKISAEIQKNNSKLIVSVTDTGIGIKDENKNKLFKDYSKINEENSINKLGDGLGLSICKYFAKKLNIKINYKSEYGKGTRFDLIFEKKIKEKTESKISKEYNSDDLHKCSKSLNSKLSEKSSKFKFSSNSMDSFSLESGNKDYYYIYY